MDEKAKKTVEPKEITVEPKEIQEWVSDLKVQLYHMRRDLSPLLVKMAREVNNIPSRSPNYVYRLRDACAKAGHLDLLLNWYCADLDGLVSQLEYAHEFMSEFGEFAEKPTTTEEGDNDE